MPNALTSTTAIIAATALGWLANTAPGGDDPALTSEVFATPSSAMYLTYAPGQSNHVYVIRRGGQIDIYNLNGSFVGEFLDISAKIDTFNFEGGLLGIAFHPDYQDNGYFYLNYTTSDDGDNDRTRIERYSVSGDPDIADPDSDHIIMEYGQPAGNHNGGWIGFGPNDGYLYIASGDGGGSQNGPTGGGARSQDTVNRLGKILRVDVDSDQYAIDPLNNFAIPPDNPFIGGPVRRGGLNNDATWAYGLRNPFRCGFDRETGDFYIADVGQNTWEEVNIQHADSPGGENYGWNCQEGEICLDNDNCDCPEDDIVMHTHAYDHNDGSSITGGTVYRGCAMPELQGTYFFADWGSATIWSLRYDRDTQSIGPVTDRTVELDPGPGSINGIVGFGEDAYGEVYICSLFGTVFKIIPASAPADANDNGIPDICEQPGDADGDGDVDLNDLLMVIAGWGSPGPDGDVDNDGDVDLNDLLSVIANWGSSIWD